MEKAQAYISIFQRRNEAPVKASSEGGRWLINNLCDLNVHSLNLSCTLCLISLLFISFPGSCNTSLSVFSFHIPGLFPSSHSFFSLQTKQLTPQLLFLFDPFPFSPGFCRTKTISQKWHMAFLLPHLYLLSFCFSSWFHSVALEPFDHSPVFCVCPLVAVEEVSFSFSPIVPDYSSTPVLISPSAPQTQEFPQPKCLPGGHHNVSPSPHS